MTRLGRLGMGAEVGAEWGGGQPADARPRQHEMALAAASGQLRLIEGPSWAWSTRSWLCAHAAELHKHVQVRQSQGLSGAGTACLC